MKDASFYVQQVVEGVIGVISIFGNALVLYVIWRYRDLHTRTNYLIASLAAADLLVGAIGVYSTYLCSAIIKDLSEFLINIICIRQYAQ